MGKAPHSVISYANQWISHGVAFQLTLDTFISVYRKVMALQTVITRSFGLPLAALAFTKNHQRVLNHLFNDVEALVSPSSHNLIAQHLPGDGPLGQLVSDCNKLIARHACPHALQLSQLADKAWLEAHKAIQSFMHERELTNSENTPRRLPFLAHVMKIVRTIERFAITWPRALKELRSDENLFYFLLRRRQDLDSLCKKGFVKELFASLFPHGMGELRSMIISGYKNRGFDHLIPAVDGYLDEIGSW